MSITRLALTLLLAGLWLAVPAARHDDDDKLTQLLARLDDYFQTYETELTSVTAEERYEQQQTMPGYKAQGPAGSQFRLRKRILYSEMAFVRLPGDAEWAGYRDVREVDGKRVSGGTMRLGELLTKGADIVAQAAAITAASSEYNLGAMRTVNMPTIPLELLHPRHRHRFTYKIAGSEPILGLAETVRLDFIETTRPTVIRGPGGIDVPSDGSAWVDPKNGRLWRAQVLWRHDRDAFLTNRIPRIMVEYRMDRRLKTMVPIEMREIFFVDDGVGQAHATYSNFKRFETKARLIGISE